MFVLSAAYFWYLAARDLSFADGLHDLADELWAARTWGVQHPTGSPVYISLGWLVTRGVTEWGAVAHRLSTTLAAVPAALTAALLYWRTRNLLAPLLFCGSVLIVSQSGIAKYYSLVSLIVLCQWLTRRTPWFWAVSLVGVATHHLPGFALLIITAWRWRHGLSWWPMFALAPLTFGIYYGYWRFAAPAPQHMGWSGAPFIQYMGGQGFLFFGLSPWPWRPFVERLRDVALIVSASLGLGLVGLLWVKDRWLLWIIGLFTAYYAADLDPHTYTYLVVPVTLAIYAVCQADCPIRLQWLTGAVAVVMIGWNLTHMALGVNLDPEPTAARQVYEQFAQVPTGAVVDVAGFGPYAFMPYLFGGRMQTVNGAADAVGVTHCLLPDYDGFRGTLVMVDDPRCVEQRAAR